MNFVRCVVQQLFMKQGKLLWSRNECLLSYIHYAPNWHHEKLQKMFVFSYPNNIIVCYLFSSNINKLLRHHVATLLLLFGSRTIYGYVRRSSNSGHGFYSYFLHATETRLSAACPYKISLLKKLHFPPVKNGPWELMKPPEPSSACGPLFWDTTLHKLMVDPIPHRFERPTLTVRPASWHRNPVEGPS